MLKSDNDDIPRDAVVDNMFSFIAADHHVDLCLQWVEQGAILSEQKPIY